MKDKIAIITTDFLVDYIHDTFSRMQLDCTYEIFVYKTFSDIPELYRKIPDDIVGVLTSGSFPARVIKLTFPNTQRVIIPFNTDDAAICQMFFRLLDEDRFLNFDRIYADLVEMFNIDLKTYLTQDFTTPLSITSNRIVYEKGLEELYQIEELEYQKHLKLWNSGTVDLCVTRFSSIVERLREQGVRVYFPYPSAGYLREICQMLFREIEYKQLKDNSSAVINVSIPGLGQENTGSTLEYQLLTIQAACMEFMGEKSLDYFFRRSVNGNGLEILTNRKNIVDITDGYTICKMRSQLSKCVDSPLYIGYGIGNDLYQARVNAQNALGEAEKQSLGASFVCDENDSLIGPLDAAEADGAAIVAGQPTKRQDARTGVSDSKINQVRLIMEEMPEGQITSGQLAEKMGITKRSANRILSSMEEQQILRVAKTRFTSTKGRPERIYSMRNREE